jgi:hypothetical protein
MVSYFIWAKIEEKLQNQSPNSKLFISLSKFIKDAAS